VSGLVSATSARPEVPLARYVQRLEGVRRLGREQGLDAVLIGPGADLRYLTGYAAPLLERLTILVVPVEDGRPVLIAPRLEELPARACPTAEARVIDVRPWQETEDPIALVGHLVGPAHALAVSDRLWATFVLGLQRAIPGAAFTLASSVMKPLRIVKDEDEIALLRLAAEAADRAVDQIAAGRLLDRTEAQVARDVRGRLIDEGHELAEFAIVGSGPHSASPHHEATDRRIEAGEPIVLDIGGRLGGYGSDITRTIWVTGGDKTRGPDSAFLELYGVLRDAQAAARDAIRPGVACGRLDAVAREIIAAGGFGPHFIHRLGHGIGLEEHEEPYLVAGNDLRLAPGMAFSVEPGIYLEGRYGARIEDIVVCGVDGPTVLNGVTRDLRVVEG